MKHEPATALPWKAASAFVNNAPNVGVVTTGKWGAANVAQCSEQKNADYIAHAANAYPRLVAALRACLDARETWTAEEHAAYGLLRELGEQS